MKIDIEYFNHLKNNQAVNKFTLQNGETKVVLTNYGASLISVFTKDRDGKLDDILLGFDNIQGYLENRFFGSTVGRCANRINAGKFNLGDKTFQLERNNGKNHLHGGSNGFDTKVWGWNELPCGVEFTLESGNGDEGYPGHLLVKSSYELVTPNKLLMNMTAMVLDEPTIVNLTNHAFINLSGQSSSSTEDILGHHLQINASSYLECQDLIPTGTLKDVNDVFDFRRGKLIGENFPSDGYDHNYCLDENEGYDVRLIHPQSGRVLEIKTNQPGIQFYTGNFIDTVGKNGKAYKPRHGLCLEPQIFPDAINHENFPSPILRPGEKYENQIGWTFATK